MDLALVLAVRLGPLRLNQLIHLARGGQQIARRELETAVEGILLDNPAAARTLEDAGLLGAAAEWTDPSREAPVPREVINLVDGVEGQGVNGRPPVRSATNLLVERVVGPSRPGRPPTAGGLRDRLRHYHQLITGLINEWRIGGRIPHLADDERQLLQYVLPEGRATLPTPLRNEEVRRALRELLHGKDVGAVFRYSVADFLDEEGHERLFLDPARENFWRAVESPAPADQAAYRFLAISLREDEESIRRAAGTGRALVRPREDVHRWIIEERGLRAIIAFPLGTPEDALRQLEDQLSELTNDARRGRLDGGAIQKFERAVDLSWSVRRVVLEGGWVLWINLASPRG